MSRGGVKPKRHIPDGLWKIHSATLVDGTELVDVHTDDLDDPDLHSMWFDGRIGCLKVYVQNEIRLYPSSRVVVLRYFRREDPPE